jgi:hypothetical protein
MKNTAMLAIIAAVLLAVSAGPARGRDSEEPCSLLYTEKLGDEVSSKKYSIDRSASGYEITIAKGEIRRRIITDENLATVRESYWHTENSDRVDVERKGDRLVFHGRVDGETIHHTEEIEDEVWYGSVLLLKDFVLSDRPESLFYVTRPEDAKAVLIKAVREDVETVTVDSKSVDAVRIKYTVPDIRGLFWKSYYWYRQEDGLLVKTKETRGPPGTPKALVELEEETSCRGSDMFAAPSSRRIPVAAQ